VSHGRLSRSSAQRETAQLVHDRVGPVASFRTALVVVAGVPKTRSGKTLCGTMRTIAAGENYGGDGSNR
jgi:propionyl-CoA synthetase